MDRPQRRGQVDLRPRHLANVAGPLEEEGGQLERGAGEILARVLGDRAHQRDSRSGLQHGRHVLDDDGPQCAVQIGRRVAFAASGGDAVAEDLAGRLSQRVRRLRRATPLDPTQRVKKQRRGDGGQRQAADPGEQILFHAFDPALDVLLAPGFELGGVQFACDSFERRPCLCLVGELVQLPLLGGVDARALQLASLVACVTRSLQRNDDLR
jgi:hypothetical protein